MEKTKRDLLRFLELPELAEIPVPHLEQNSAWRSETTRRVFEFLKESTHRLPFKPKIGLLSAISRLGKKPARRKELQSEFRSKLREEFSGEISLLSKLLGRDFSNWR